MEERARGKLRKLGVSALDLVVLLDPFPGGGGERDPIVVFPIGGHCPGGEHYP